jgi:hypothetical protein
MKDTRWGLQHRRGGRLASAFLQELEPAGTFTNLADATRWAQWIVPRDDPRFAMCVVQLDHHCRDVAAGDMTRKRRGRPLLGGAEDHEAPAWRRRANYHGVRIWALLRWIGAVR